MFFTGKRGILKKTFSIMTITACTTMFLSGCHVEYADEDPSDTTAVETANTDDTIRVWYTDNSFTKYLEKCKEDYERTSGNKVSLELVDVNNYLSDILAESGDRANAVDVYLIQNSNLEEAYLAGLTQKNTKTDIYNNSVYCNTALSACTYKNNLIAYPLSYSTSFYIYNKGVMGDKQPKSFDDLEAMAEELEFNTEKSANIQAIFRCDFNDIFLNYGFLGSYFNIGGTNGDDKAQLSLNNDKAVNVSKKYVNLMNYYFIDRTAVNYSQCVDDFLGGKIVSTIMSTESINKLTDSKIQYSILPLLDYSDTMETSPLSETEVAVVNPFTSNSEQAQAFAKFITYDEASVLYEQSGKLSARSDISYINKEFANIYKSYIKSVSENKLMYGAQVYTLLEIAFHSIVDGSDASKELESVQTYMQNQWK